MNDQRAPWLWSAMFAALACALNALVLLADPPARLSPDAAGVLRGLLPFPAASVADPALIACAAWGAAAVRGSSAGRCAAIAAIAAVLTVGGQALCLLTWAALTCGCLPAI